MTILPTLADAKSVSGVHLHARVTGTLRGRRIFRDVVIRNVVSVELDFIPAAEGLPAEARVHHAVWDGRLGRCDTHVILVVQDWALLAQVPWSMRPAVSA